MERPACVACKQRFCAVNYHRAGVAHYRARCEHCIKKNKHVKLPVARWHSAGYKKKSYCDLCKFRAKYAAQLLVCHVDGNMNNVDVRNLKTICQNCVIDVMKSTRSYRSGDLEPDR